MPGIDATYAEFDDDSRSRLGAALGVPDEDIRSASGELLGRRRRYANGVMLWRQSTDTAWAVYGAIYVRYQAVREVLGELGWPLSHELAWEPRGRLSRAPWAPRVVAWRSGMRAGWWRRPPQAGRRSGRYWRRHQSGSRPQQPTNQSNKEKP